MDPRPPRLAVVALLFATFTMAAGYGLLLPVLPGLVERLAPAAPTSVILHHAGLVTAAYAAGALLAAVLSGRLADRWARPHLVVAALGLSAAATLAVVLVASLSGLYLLRFLAGLGAGAAGPAVQGWLGRWARQDESWRARRLVWTALAATAGFFAGPLIGGVTASAGPALDMPEAGADNLSLLGGTTILLLAAAAVALAVGAGPGGPGPRAPRATALLLRRAWRLLLPLGLVAVAVSAFEVALAFVGGGRGMSSLEVGLLFGACTLVMFLAQAVLAMPRFERRSWAPLRLPGLALLATGLVLLPLAGTSGWHLLATTLVALGGGLIPPILARDISALDHHASGTLAGLSSATGLAGQMLGAAMASLVASAERSDWIFLTAAALLVPAAIVMTRPAGPPRVTEHAA